MRAGLPAALTAAAAYALLELAFFAQHNLLLPWSPEHFRLVPVFFALHAGVALAGLGLAGLAARMLPGGLTTALPSFLPAALLVAVHALTHYRERVNALPRDLRGSLVSLGILAGMVGAGAAAAFAFRRAPRRAVGAGRLLAGALLAVGLFRCATVEPVGRREAGRPRRETEPLEAKRSGQRVLLFGFDGATWDVLDPLIAAGRLPHIAALAARGRTFAVETFRPTFSPVIWTTVATGKNRFQHGIHDVVQTVLPGGTLLPRSIRRTAFLTKTTGVVFRLLNAHRAFRLEPYRSEQVRARSIFQVASEAGLRTSAVEWYVTWPAAPLTGVNVSDRFHLRGPDGRPLRGSVFPERLARELAPEVVGPEEIPLERVLDFVEIEDLTPPEKRRWAEKHKMFVEEMRHNLARDLTTRNVALDLLERENDWQLFGVYFRAVDVSHHLTWAYRNAPGDPRGDPELRLRSVIDRYHEFMDAIVGEVLGRVPEGAVVVLLSDHGFEDRYAHSRAPEGFAILAGGAVVPAAGRGRIRVFEIAPTVAVLLGLPVAEDLEAEPRTDLLDPRFLDAHPLRRVRTWEREGGEPRGAAARVEIAPGVSASEIERLRALGYIQ